MKFFRSLSARIPFGLLLLLMLPASLRLEAQTTGSLSTKWNPWETEQSTSTEALRGIHAVGQGVAWASGAHGTVLRTEDAGYVWQKCQIPPDGSSLDFRSVWAWDAKTAIVMSSGTGKLSRLYKTTDGCVHWRLLHTNTDETGFWDGLAFSDSKNGFLIGDPVGGHFVLLRTADGGEHWTAVKSKDLNTGTAKLGIFAASNSAMVLSGPALGPVYIPWFGTSGVSGGAGPFVYTGGIDCTMGTAHSNPSACLNRNWEFEKHDVPLASGSESAGVFAVGLRQTGPGAQEAVAVGGDYTKPGESSGTAAYRDPKTGKWLRASKLPHGYRSGVAWDKANKAWITVGPNGSDVSYDEGKSWSELGDDGYNAISLPWVVGPEGRIGKLVSLKGR